MKINRISTYVLVCLLAFSKWNLIVPVRSAGEDGSSTTTPDGSGGDSSTVKTDQDGTGTTPSETVKKTPFELDIKKDAGTNEFDYKKDGKIATFTAKDNYAFNVVKQDKNEIWRTEKETEYASRVVLNGKGQKKKTVTIHMPDGTTKSFKREAKDKPWNEVSQDNKTDDGSTTKTGVDLNITSDTKSKDKFSYDKVGEYVTYISKDNYAFKLVKDDDTEVWEASDASNYSLRIEVDLINNDAKAVTVYLDENKTKLFKKNGENDPWNEIDLTKVTPSSINIDYPHESYFYKNELDNNIRTFTAKTGFAFNGANEYIGDNKVEIWKTDNESEYANKIVNEGGKKLTIYIGDDGTAKVFNKGSDGKWTENTS